MKLRRAITQGLFSLLAIACVCRHVHAQAATDPSTPASTLADELVPGSEPGLFEGFRFPDASRALLSVDHLFAPLAQVGVAIKIDPPRFTRPIWFQEQDATDAQYDAVLAQRASCVEQLRDAQLATPEQQERATLVRPGVCLALVPARPSRNSPDAAYRWVSLVPGELDASPEIESAWFHFLRATKPSVEAPPRGIVLLMPGLLGTPEGTLTMLTSRLRAEGWHVLRMVAQPSRFTQRTTLELDPEEPNRAAQNIVREMGPRTIACGLATRAVFELVNKDPELAKLPRVAIGFSAGAMTLPTVVAAEPHAYAAAIMVGGGSHFWLMSQTSNYTSWISAITPRWTREPSDAERRAIEDAYLDLAAFDSFHTAQVLRAIPTLMIQGSADLAVPSPLGDALWERAGKPERWVYPLGHELLFAQLPGVFPKLIDWLDKAVPRGLVLERDASSVPANTGAGGGTP